MPIHRLAPALALLVAGAARADAPPPLPKELAFVTSVLHLNDQDFGGYPGITYFDLKERLFSDGEKRQGKFWELLGKVDGKDDAKWSVMKAAFASAGWTVAREPPPVALFHYAKSGVEAWAELSFGDFARVTLIEAGAPPRALVLKPPAPAPEKMAVDKGDFPYLPPLPGMTFHGGGEDTTPFWVHLPDAKDPELIAEKSLMRRYAKPPQLSNLEFMTAYRPALLKAGWDIVFEHDSADASIIAHFAKHGRDLWAILHLNSEGMTINVAEHGGDLKAALAKDCRVALYGVLFDFNKATLLPASDPVLQRVLALMKKSPSLALEVEGHTDAVGDDAYNQKLSEERAATVAAWLKKHGVAAARLSSRGYGKTRPVADNRGDEGRARNRRVEIADPKCKTSK